MDAERAAQVVYNCVRPAKRPHGGWEDALDLLIRPRVREYRIGGAARYAIPMLRERAGQSLGYRDATRVALRCFHGGGTVLDDKHAILVGLALRSRLATIDVATLFLLAVVYVASRYRQGPAVLASVLSIALFDFLFVPPYYTFGVQDTRYFLTFAVMLAVSLTMTRLTERIREQAETARAGERRTAAVYAMDVDLRAAASRPAVLAIAARHIGEAAGGEATIALVDETPAPGSAPAWPIDGVFDSVPVRVAAAWAYERGESAGSGTHHGAEAEALVVPIKTPTRGFGVVAVRPEPPGRMIEASQRRTVEAPADLLATELGRA